MAVPKLNRWWHGWMASQRDALVLMAQDDHWRDFVARRPQLPSAIIPNGISPPPEPGQSIDRAVVRRGFGIPANCSFVVGTIGRLHPDRKPLAYVPIFAGIARAVEDVHFLVGGDGPEAGAMKEAVRSAGLGDRVHFAGLLLDAGAAFAASDLYLTVNVGDTTGIAAMEAAFAGVPIVGLQLLADRRPDEGDWIWSSGDPAEVAVRCVELLRSPEARRALAKRQRRRVQERHSAQAMYRDYLALYEKVLRSPTTRTPALTPSSPHHA